MFIIFDSEDFGGTQQHPAGSTTLRAFFLGELRPAQSAPGRLCAGGMGFHHRRW
jgi:hypothetical protein